MDKCFTISERHYNLIIDQAHKNFPKECGGFVGGKELTISAVLPVHNKHLYNKTDTFGLHSEDFERAHLFFSKHKLSYFGVYHTHPNGVAYPSGADIKTNQKYHFIVALNESDKPVMRAFEIIKGKPFHVPITIQSDSVFSVVNIKGDGSVSREKLQKTFDEEASDLSKKISDMKSGTLKYEKLNPKTGFDASDFSTFA